MQITYRQSTSETKTRTESLESIVRRIKQGSLTGRAVFLGSDNNWVPFPKLPEIQMALRERQIIERAEAKKQAEESEMPQADVFPTFKKAGRKSAEIAGAASKSASAAIKARQDGLFFGAIKLAGGRLQNSLSYHDNDYPGLSVCLRTVASVAILYFWIVGALLVLTGAMGMAGNEQGVIGWCSISGSSPLDFVTRKESLGYPAEYQLDPLSFGVSLFWHAFNFVALTSVCELATLFVRLEKNTRELHAENMSNP